MLPTALVTGAGGGIGREVAIRLAALGHPVAVTDVDRERLATTAERIRGVLSVAADATDPGAVTDVVTRVERELGPIGVLVNALGVYGPRRPFEESDPDEWWRVVETNVRGPALYLRAVLTGMRRRGRGHVINLNSRAATWDDPGGSSAAYSTSKAALARLTGAVAAELDGSGVVVVDLSPGLVRTNMTLRRPDLDDLPDDAFLPPTRAVDHVEALVSGRYDALHGHFVHARDDLDVLVARLEDDPSRRRVTLGPIDGSDPVA